MVERSQIVLINSECCSQATMKDLKVKNNLKHYQQADKDENRAKSRKNELKHCANITVWKVILLVLFNRKKSCLC